MKKFIALELSIQFYQSCENLKIPYFLKNQLLRAASSTALNLSEGNYRKTQKDRKRFFNISYSSNKEALTALRLASINNKKIIDLNDHVSACIFNLIKNC